MSSISADLITVSGALRFIREGAVVPINIPANGVLDVTLGNGSAITLGGGGATQLVGIRYLDPSGAEMQLEQDWTDSLFIRAAPGVSITIMHEQSVDLVLDPLPANRRTVTSSGNSYMLETVNSHGFYAYVPVAGAFRWYFFDRQAYNPAEPAHWAGSPPTSIQSGIDRLAAGFFAQHGQVPA